MKEPPTWRRVVALRRYLNECDNTEFSRRARVKNSPR
jgi:hypothetical protein